MVVTHSSLGFEAFRGDCVSGAVVVGCPGERSAELREALWVSEILFRQITDLAL